MMPKTMHTMARSYRDICAGEDPWTALGNFANAWYDYAKDNRAALVSEPLGKPGQDTEHTRHWAAFCAASVEFLCDRYRIPCPTWVRDPSYILSTPTLVALTLVKATRLRSCRAASRSVRAPTAWSL